LRDRVRAAVHKLPEDQRLVLELRLRGLSSRQIADEIGLSADAVRQRESRASKRLRELLSGSSAGGES
ncbi:MAG: sigma-70 family RNA polymerase sigma factor, partial [Planctomycetota bacterium]